MPGNTGRIIRIIMAALPEAEKRGPALATARGGSRMRPHRHDLPRERSARRKSMPDISPETGRTTDTSGLCADDEQQSYRRKWCRLTRAANKSPVLFTMSSTRWQRSWPGWRRRSQPGLRHFQHGLPALPDRVVKHSTNTQFGTPLCRHETS
jgi:hypothetical protein